MIAQPGLSLLPFSFLAIVFLLLVIIVLMQCAKKHGSSIESGNGAFRRHSSYEDYSNQNETEKDLVVIATNDGQNSIKEMKPRATTVNSTGSGCMDMVTRPKEPTPLPERNNSKKSRKSSEDLSVQQQNKVENEAVGVKVEAVNQCQPPNDGTPTEGSYENSGDSIYTKVKSVPKKEECAYSVVELSSKDAEYEMVEGKLHRLEKETKTETKKVEINEYEDISYSLKRKIPLDPVLFAVEDSGASGIYEDVPDSKVVEPQHCIKKEEIKQQENKKEPVKHHEQKTKKWGLTRFSKRNKNKNNSGNANDMTDFPHHSKGSPKSSDERSYLSDCSDSNDIIQNRKTKKISPKGAAAIANQENIPPPPPIENLRLKADHRRTIHMMEASADPVHSPQSPALPPQPHFNSILTGHKFPVATPNDYTAVNEGISTGMTDIVDADQLYEEPDREVLHPTRGNIEKRPKEAGSLHQINNKNDVDYETISCDIDLTNDNYKSYLDSDDVRETSDVNQESKDQPQYAVVNRRSTKHVAPKMSTGEPEEARERTVSSYNGPKIEVFITKTKISTQTSDDGELQDHKASGTKAEDHTIDLNKVADFDVAPKDIDVLYAKVDMVKKREEEAKRALYASVTKEKTGKCTYYDEDDISHEMTPEEFEDGHYSRIKDERLVHGDTEDQDSSAEESESERIQPQATSEDNQYEIVTEQKNIEKFASLRASKNSNSTAAGAGKVIKKSFSDYEEI